MRLSCELLWLARCLAVMVIIFLLVFSCSDSGLYHSWASEASKNCWQPRFPSRPGTPSAISFLRALVALFATSVRWSEKE